VKKEIRLAFTGGGSGGHAMPAFSMVETVKEYFDKNNIECRILYIGSKNGIESGISKKYEVDFRSISTGKLRRYFSLKNFTDIFRIFAGLFQSMALLNKFKPVLLFSTGGFVSVPPVIAAKFKKIPVIIHEQTIDAGLANKIASKFADKICITFNESKKYFPEDKTEVTGIPLRKEIFCGTPESARTRFGFDPELPVVFFYGGGLGCRMINETGIEILPSLLEKCNVIFQTGKSGGNRDFIRLKVFYESLPAEKRQKMRLFDFINEEIGDILAISKLAVARSGAGTVCEFMSLKLPAIFIPLAIATNNEQYQNAMILKKAGCAEIIEEKDFDPKVLLALIDDLLFSGKSETMKNNYKGLSSPDGKQNLLKIVLSYLS
jgi:UDP-N-acetylglucosamine--N-acetylmuramyl-(pentapeptide) pyrophosphoryl-undecaprenol N-acetylglucosamine transferase